MNGYQVFNSQLNEVVNNYPSLQIIGRDSKRFLVGKLPIIDPFGKIWETYEVEIYPVPDYPKRFPKVIEISNKIKRVPDWHVNRDNSLCIDIEPSEIQKCQDGITVLSFIEKELIPHLANQTHRKIEGYYVNGEYSHGILGLFEYYSNILLTGGNKEYTLKLLHYTISNSKPQLNSKCFCGRIALYRSCHMPIYNKLVGIGRKTLQKHYHLMINWYQSNN